VPVGITVLVVSQFWGILAGQRGIAPPVPSLLMGMMIGLVSVPLRALYQLAVPADARGNAMSVMNTVCYLFTTAVAVLMYVLIETHVLDNETTQLLFLLMLEIAGAVVAWRILLPPALELLVELLLWPVYRVHARGPGAGRVPLSGPLIVVANHSSYFDPFWVAKLMPRRLTPLMTSRFFDLPVIRWLMTHIVGAIRVPQVRYRREAPELRDAAAVLRQGGCLLMFPEAILRRKEVPILRTFGRGVWQLLRERPQTPVLVLWIEGGWGSWASYKGGPPMRRKRLDFWRHIHIGMHEPEVLDAEVLADHRTTRRHLMRRCLEARRYLGLNVPAGALPPTLELEDEPAEEEVPSDEPDRQPQN
jgi:1-acyl-sn-glycerol-3-phosphate acyltransferase